MKIERNIINQEAIDDALNTLINNAELKNFPSVEDYVKRNIRNHIYRKAPAQSVWAFQYKKDVTPLQKKIQEKGGPFHSITLEASFLQEISHVIDFLRAHPSLVKESLDYESAIAQSKTWTKKLQKQEIRDGEVIEVLKEYEDGLTMVKLVNEASFVLEGQRMRHCVGSYAGRSSTRVYSLRDKENKPIITLSEKDNIIDQYVMVANSAVTKQYYPYLNSFARDNKFQFYKSRGGSRGGPDISKMLLPMITTFMAFKTNEIISWFGLEGDKFPKSFSTFVALGLGMKAFMDWFDWFANIGGTITYEKIDQLGEKNKKEEAPKSDETSSSEAV